MNLYTLIRPLAFLLPPETAHTLALKVLLTTQRCGFLRLICKQPKPDPITLMGLQFPNRVGLAAGLDKNGDYIDALAQLGFGFIEIGTVTPKPQLGNPRPRLFRLPQARAIINRMGFNNKGVDHLIRQVKHSTYQGVLGINIGKNFDTPLDKAVDDYAISLRKVYPYASYIALNISSPNTKNLRQLQQEEALHSLLTAVKSEQLSLQTEHGRYVPLVIKIAPDLNETEIECMATLFRECGIDGVIATNTTVDRTAVVGLPYCAETGGLSGAPLTEQSTRVVTTLAKHLDDKSPIIAAGGIMSAKDASDKLRAGAQLVQLYSGLIYAGPSLITETVTTLSGNDYSTTNR